MPERGTHTTIVEYSMAKRGVNLYGNIVDMHPEEAIFTQNCIWKNGMMKRGGSTKFETDEVSTGKKIAGLHRFYYGASSKQTLAASGTVVKYHDGATWQNVRTGMTDGQQVFMASWLDNAFIANGTDQPSRWDGTTNTSVAAAPANTVQFLPYQDRLLSITGGDLTWSASFSYATWESVANCGVRPDSHLFGMSLHSSTNVASGYDAKVLLAGANGMYLFYGSDMRVPFTTGDYVIYPLSGSLGCNAPRTMCWTPKGTMYLGIDKQVYLLPFGSPMPIQVGTKIQSNTHLAGIEGIEHIPAGQLPNACAVFHDGYYKLSVARSGSAVNTTQWWLDLSRLQQDENGLWGPWYGPMLGQSISCFMVQSGAGDTGECYGGESNAATGSFIYELYDDDAYGDNGTAIQIYYQTLYHPLTSLFLRKDVHRIELELLDVLGTVSVDFFDIEGALRTGDTVALSGNAVYWNDAYWDEQYWSSSMPTRRIINIGVPIQPRRLSILVKHVSNDDTFELYALRVEAIEQNVAFA